MLLLCKSNSRIKVPPVKLIFYNKHFGAYMYSIIQILTETRVEILSRIKAPMILQELLWGNSWVLGRPSCPKILKDSRRFQKIPNDSKRFKKYYKRFQKIPLIWEQQAVSSRCSKSWWLLPLILPPKNQRLRGARIPWAPKKSFVTIWHQFNNLI